MAKTVKKARTARRPRYQSTESLVAALGARSLDDLNELADQLKEQHPWGASFLAARLKAPVKPALPPDVPADPGAPETPVFLGDHATRMDAINAEAMRDV